MMFGKGAGLFCFYNRFSVTTRISQILPSSAFVGETSGMFSYTNDLFLLMSGELNGITLAGVLSTALPTPVPERPF